MKRRRCSVEQIVVAVKPHESGTPAADIASQPVNAEGILNWWTTAPPFGGQRLE